MNKTNFKFNQVTAPVYEFGHGDKVLLVLHGWGSSLKSWKTVLEQIDPGTFHTYFLELPGFGDATEPNTAWTVSDYVSFVKKFTETLPNKPVYLLVHSFGARLAIKWLALENTPFEKAIFIGAAGIRPHLNLVQKCSKKIALILSKFKNTPGIRSIYKIGQKLLYKLLGTKDYLKVTGTMKTTFVNVIEEDLTPYLEKIKIPVSLIWGKKDSYTPLWMGKLMHQKIKNSKLEVIEDGKHGLHLQMPDLLEHNVSEFFK